MIGLTWIITTVLPLCFAIDIQTSELFIKKIDPALFNWASNASSSGYRFRASLANKPDLPSWLSYIYSERHAAGFIFGVPPPNSPSFNVDLISTNKDTYETQVKTIHLNVTDKQDPAKFEVHLKIDNLNVEDMFDSHRLQKLLNVFTSILWKSSKDNLYVTFLASAVRLGARLPLRPQEGEGVVIRLGSREEFSEELRELQDEVKPLWKFTSCPRDLKRTSVDRHFRSQGFILDWCSFRLVKLESESGNAHYKEAAADILGSSGWELPDKYLLPSRDYSSEILTTLIVPVSTLVVLWIFLSFILCFQHDSMSKKVDDEVTLAQYQAVQRATDTLRSMDSNRNTETSPRLTSERMDTCRPTPPPYSATKRIVADS